MGAHADKPMRAPSGARWTWQHSRWYGQGRPVADEPHQFIPATDDDKRAYRWPRPSLLCRSCGRPGLYGKDGRYRHTYLRWTDARPTCDHYAVQPTSSTSVRCLRCPGTATAARSK